MNMVKLHQILELRRAIKAPPLIPPKTKRKGDVESKKGPKEIIDIHLKLKLRKPEDSTPIKNISTCSSSLQTNKSTTNKNSKVLVCVFSESDEPQTSSQWKVSTAAELISDPKKPEGTTSSWDLRAILAVEFQLEHCQFIKLELCEISLEKQAAINLGYTIFAVSELVICKNGSILRQLVNDENGFAIADTQISCTLRPKPHSILLQFATKNITKKNIIATNSTQIFFEIHRLENASSIPNVSTNSTTQQQQQQNGIDSTIVHNRQLTTTITDSADLLQLLQQHRTTTVLYRSESVKGTASRFIWRSFSLQSTEIIDRILELVCFYRDSKTTKGYVGRFLMRYDQLRKGPSPENVYFLICENSHNQQKNCGTFELLRINEVALPSFLEFISSGSVLNFACAIDFSRASNAPIDASQMRQYLEDVELIIQALGEPLKHFNCSTSFAAFGFGAKIPPHFRESQEFCLNLDTDPYCRGLDGVQKAFRNAFANVQPINVAHLSHVIYYMAKLAQSALNRNQSSASSTTLSSLRHSSSSQITPSHHPSYYVLVVITRGVFDDLKETVQALIFASRAPISVVFVAIDAASTDSDESTSTSPTGELERMATAGTRLNYHGRKPERDCFQYVCLSRCRKEEPNLIDLKGLIAEKALLNVPWQMATWMTKNGFRPSSAIVCQDPIEETTAAMMGEQVGIGKCGESRAYLSQRWATSCADSLIDVIAECGVDTPSQAMPFTNTIMMSKRPSVTITPSNNQCQKRTLEELTARFSIDMRVDSQSKHSDKSRKFSIADEQNRRSREKNTVEKAVSKGVETNTSLAAHHLGSLAAIQFTPNTRRNVQSEDNSDEIRVLDGRFNTQESLRHRPINPRHQQRRRSSNTR